MGTRSLGQRPWLIADDDFDRDLQLKRELLAERRQQVLHTTDPSRPAATQLAEMVGADPDSTEHPIEAAALAVQEDLCLLERKFTGWFVDASCLCFPTRWHLQAKVNQHIADVHGPVDGYDPRITTRVDQLFDRLTERPVWRRNWFLMTDTALHQPDRPLTETIVASDRVRQDLFIRSERQTLRALSQDWIVFTIRIQQKPVGELLTTPDREAAFANWVRNVSTDFGLRRHLTDPQRREILAALT